MFTMSVINVFSNFVAIPRKSIHVMVISVGVARQLSWHAAPVWLRTSIVFVTSLRVLFLLKLILSIELYFMIQQFIGKA